LCLFFMPEKFIAYLSICFLKLSLLNLEH
jgi:hypothetical protein